MDRRSGATPGTTLGNCKPNDPESTAPAGSRAGVGGEPHRVVLEKTTDEDLPTLPPESRVAGYDPAFEVAGIGERARSLDEGSRGGFVDRSVRLQVEGFMRPLGVMDPSEVVEASLLRPQSRPGRVGCAFLEGPMHAFVATVLLGFPGLDASVLNRERIAEPSAVSYTHLTLPTMQ